MDLLFKRTHRTFVTMSFKTLFLRVFLVLSSFLWISSIPADDQRSIDVLISENDAQNLRQILKATQTVSLEIDSLKNLVLPEKLSFSVYKYNLMTEDSLDYQFIYKVDLYKRIGSTIPLDSVENICASDLKQAGLTSLMYLEDMRAIKDYLRIQLNIYQQENRLR